MESSNYANGTVQNCTNFTIYNARIVITVQSAAGLLLEFIVSMILLRAKAYQTFLQRLFVWIVLALIVMDTTRVTSFVHQLLPDKVCGFVGFLQRWFLWCIFVFLLVMIV